MWKTKFGRCIYTSPSGYKVYENLFYRWLTFGSKALQTLINRHNPQKPGLYYLPALTLMARHYPAPTCLLGLGGAGAALMLSQSVVAVDCSAEIIDIAKRFFIDDRLKNLNIIEANAQDFIKTTEETYSHLLIDLYNAYQFPPECNNEQFFAACRNKLGNKGILSINLANPYEQWTIYQLVKKYFYHTLVIPVSKSANMVIIASNNEFIERIKETKEIKKMMWIEPWGIVGVRSCRMKHCNRSPL